MAEKVIAASLQLDGKQAQASVKSFKQELREANESLIQIQHQFGPTSEQALAAARNVAELRDRMQEAREITELYDPGARFQVFGNVLRTVAGSMSALTGTLALFGEESKDVEKAILKVQAALAVTEGVNTIVDAMKDFDRLKAVAVDTFKAIKTAIGSTGIGAVLLAVGLLVAYWDDIKETVSGVTAEERKSLQVTKEKAAKEKEKLDHLGEQDNVLKLQGKSEREILSLKAKQVQAAIDYGVAALKAQEVVDEAQVRTAQRNHDILAGLLQLTSGPLRLMVAGIDAIADKLGKKLNLGSYVDQAIDTVAGYLFDPKEVKEKADAANRETQAGLDKLRDQLAGYRLQERELNKKAVADEREFQKELKGIRDAAADALITDADELARRKLMREYDNQRASIMQEVRSQQQRHQLLNALEEKYQNEYAAMYVSKIKDLDERIALARQEQEDKRRKTDEDNLSKSVVQVGKNFDDLLAVFDDIRIARLDVAGRQYEGDLAKLNEWQYSAIKATNGGEEAIVAITEEYERRKTEITYSRNMQRLGVARDTLASAAEALGKATVAGKAMAVAATLIDTYQSATSSYKALSGIPIVGPALGFTAAAAAVVAGLANVKKIIATQVPGAAGGSMPSVAASAPAPLTPRPTVTNTVLPKDQINDIGNAAAARVYVLESDVTKSQERVTMLNRAARLGG